MELLYGIAADENNLKHILRAVMGLYLALIVFWIMGASKKELRIAALYSMIVFMFGLAGGRIISLIVEGLAHWLLMAYLFLELLFGTLGVIVSRK